LKEEVAKKLMEAIGQFRRMKRGHKHNPGELKPSDMMMLTKMVEMKAAGEEMSVSNLSAAMCVSKPFVTNALNAFVEAGIVERIADASDRRMVMLSVTPKGEALIEKSWKEFMAAINGLVEHLGEEKSILLTELMGETYNFLIGFHSANHSAHECEDMAEDKMGEKLED